MQSLALTPSRRACYGSVVAECAFVRLLRLVGLAVFALWLAGAVFAEETPSATPEPEAAEHATPGTEAVPIEGVAEQAVQIAYLLETLAPSAESHAAFRITKAEAERLLLRVESQVRRIRLALAGAPKVRSMQEWRVDLRGLLTPLESLADDLDKQLDGLGKALAQIDAEAARWQATRAEAATAEASTAVRDRVDATVAALEETRQQLAAQRDEILSLRDRLVEPTADVQSTRNRLSTETQERLAGIFTRDRPMLWNADLRQSIRGEFREGGSESLRERLKRLGEFTRECIPMLAFQLVLFVGLAVGLRLLGARAKELAQQDNDLRQASLVFALPTSMAFVIALTLTPLFHPYAPSLFLLLAYSVVMVPTALIVNHLLSAPNRPVVWALVVVFLVDQGREFVEYLPTFERAIFLVELIGVVVFLLWLRRPRRIAGMPIEARRDPLFRVVRGLTGVSLVLLAVAIAAEVMGLGDLADLIGTGTLRSAYLALFIYALLKVLQSLLAYALILRPLRLLKMVADHRRLVRHRIETVLGFLGFALWGHQTLVFFGLDAPLAAGVGRTLSAELSTGALAISFGDVLVLVVTIWLTFTLARLLDFVLTQDIYPRVRLPRGVPYAISTLTRYTLIVLGFLIAMAAAGIELSSLTIVAGGLGVGVGFGLQTVVSNFVSGLILLFERPLQVGDDIELGAVNGEIRRIGIRASSIRTGDGAEVIVPNSKLISDVVTNRTFRDRRRRIEISVIVNSEINAQQVVDVLLAVARKQASVLRTPPPRAFFVKLGESNLEFVLRVWIAEYRDEGMTRSQLNAALQKALADAGIVAPLRTIAPETLPKLRDEV